jgi:hypothetical protein
MPRDALGVFGWLVECEDGGQREELCNKTSPVYVLPAAAIDGVLGGNVNICVCTECI